ncbi:EamA family transporter [Dermatophilaceae bacterium Soc4.6]
MSDPAAVDALPHPAASGTSGVGSGVVLAASSAASVQFGAALAARLFPVVGPLGTVGLRLSAAGMVLTLVIRPWRRRWSRAELGAAAVLGLVFAAMNTSLYLALDRLPIATVITLEFLGPLTLAIVTAGGWAVRVWALPAAGGVALLGGGLTAGDLVGVVLALTAAACWAAYIVVNGRIGRTGTGLAGLTVGTLVAALIVVPAGVASAGTALLHPAVLATGLAVGVLSSALPYSFDLLALRRLPTAVFGVLTSLNPGMAALAGLLVLRQALAWPSLLGIGLVTVASAGVTLAPLARRSGPPG